MVNPKMLYRENNELIVVNSECHTEGQEQKARLDGSFCSFAYLLKIQEGSQEWGPESYVCGHG